MIRFFNEADDGEEDVAAVDFLSSSWSLLVCADDDDDDSISLWLSNADEGAEVLSLFFL